MKIIGARVVVCSPGRNFVTLKIETDAGLHGVGDATLNGRELAVASYLADHVVPLIVGRDPADIEDIWQFLYKGAYWRRGPVTMAAIAAVDVALWDIKGKRLDVPVYDLLGGRSRRAVRVYGHASGGGLDATVEAVGRYIAMGYTAVRVQAGIPGLPAAYGVGRGDMAYEPASPDAPAEEVWSTPRYLDFVPGLFAALRETHGWEVDLLHDAHHRLTAQEAAWLGRRLEDHRLFWLEDPVPAELQQGYRLVREHTTVPIALGEVFNSIYDCEQLLREQLIDYIRMSPVHGGGLTPLRKIAAFAETYRIRTACHGPTDVSPVSMAAALHFDLSVHNFGIQEYMRHTDETDRVFPHRYHFDAGHLHPGDAPGLGVDIDEDLAAAFPYRRAYLPVTRLPDGTVHDW